MRVTKKIKKNVSTKKELFFKKKLISYKNNTTNYRNNLELCRNKQHNKIKRIIINLSNFMIRKGKNYKITSKNKEQLWKIRSEILLNSIKINSKINKIKYLILNIKFLKENNTSNKSFII